jgi:hypothetical protein
MSNTTETQTPVVEGTVIDSSPKKYCFTRKQIIATAVAATTVAATAAAVVYLRAKGTDPKEIVDVAVDAVKETVENAN